MGYRVFSLSVCVCELLNYYLSICVRVLGRGLWICLVENLNGLGRLGIWHFGH